MDRQEAKLRVKEATDLVSLIEGYLPLKRRGRLLVAPCPFHPEKTPSFTVYEDSQHYFCYGCHKSGDVFTFLMEREGVSFLEALETLASRAGIVLPTDSRREEKKGPDPYQVLGEVRSFFQTALHAAEGEAARHYFERRGLGPAIEPWALGFQPDRPGALARFAQERRLPREVLETAGLLKGAREPLAGRAIFPIEDERGRTVAFGGRVVPGTKAAEPDGDYVPPKYWNTPESPWFAKRKVLFGLHRVKQAGTRRIVVMEGYTDVIACHLAGFTGAVATLGTSFTGDHARTVERFATEGVVLLFDGDRAGFQAAERGMRELVNSRLSVRIALLAEAKDPADVVLARPDEDVEIVTERRARFADLIEGAEDALTIWFRLLRKRIDFSHAAGVDAAARECGNLLAAVDSEVRRAALVEEMARHLAVPAEALRRTLARLPRRDPRAAEATAATSGSTGAGANGGPSAASPAARPLTRDEKAERDLLACVLAQPALQAQLSAEPYADAAVGELLAFVQEGIESGKTSTADLVRWLFSRLTDRPDLGAVLAVASDRSRTLGASPQEMFEGLQNGRRRLSNQQQVRAIRQRLHEAEAAGDRAGADDLTRLHSEQLRLDRPFKNPTDAPPNP